METHYQCQVEENVYDIYGQRGRKYFIYKDDIQVACWDKEAVTWFEADNYTILANDDADHELIMSFCLIIDNYANKDHNETVTIDIGNIGFQPKKFNANWQPTFK